ncbi:hypothetical protein HQ39_05245 [Porphyromonas sp. COT-108 OH2963]|nr:hypothetical protein HQ39_05245 [Porphyromonas sp. COT-108 OH2963]
MPPYLRCLSRSCSLHFISESLFKISSNKIALPKKIPFSKVARRFQTPDDGSHKQQRRHPKIGMPPLPSVCKAL